MWHDFQFLFGENLNLHIICFSQYQIKNFNHNKGHKPGRFEGLISDFKLIFNGTYVNKQYLENSPKQACALIGQKSCLYNSMETQN